MKGLLLKDLFLLKNSIPITLFTTLLIGAALARMNTPWLLIPITAAAFSMTAVTTIATDKATQWDKFSATLPVSKAKLVSSKYLLYLIQGLVGTILGIVFSSVAFVLTNGFDGPFAYDYLLMALTLGLLPGTFSIPMGFILTEEQSIFGNIIAYVFSSFLFIGLSRLLTDVLEVSLESWQINSIFLSVSLLLFFSSWWLFSKRATKLSF